MKNLLLGMTIICFALCASSRRVPAQTPTSTARVATGQPTSGPDDNARHFEGVIVSRMANFSCYVMTPIIPGTTSMISKQPANIWGRKLWL
jgi:hypothetical protein